MLVFNLLACLSSKISAERKEGLRELRRLLHGGIDPSECKACGEPLATVLFDRLMILVSDTPDASAGERADALRLGARFLTLLEAAEAKRPVPEVKPAPRPKVSVSFYGWMGDFACRIAAAKESPVELARAALWACGEPPVARALIRQNNAKDLRPSVNMLRDILKNPDPPETQLRYQVEILRSCYRFPELGHLLLAYVAALLSHSDSGVVIAAAKLFAFHLSDAHIRAARSEAAVISALESMLSQLDAISRDLPRVYGAPPRFMFAEERVSKKAAWRTRVLALGSRLEARLRVNPTKV